MRLDVPFIPADSCLVAFAGDLLLVAGATAGRYRYAHDPSVVQVLLRGARAWRTDVLPPLPAQRMWQACVVTEMDGEVGLYVAGGYYNGRSTMFLPLTNYR